MNATLQVLDEFRAALLRRTLASPVLRRLFHSRPERLTLLFLANSAVMLPLAILFPWFLLAVGPLVFGFVHLGATVRYSGRSLGKSRRQGVALILALVLGGVAMARHWLPPQDNAVEIAACCALLALLTGCGLIGWRETLWASALLSPLAVASLAAPAQTIQVLIIAHNFVAFFFWGKEALRKDELTAPLFCLTVFTVIHLAILLLPSENFAVAYAYGQAAHYFVWLRAIPEQHLASTAPVSFRRSAKLLAQDFGAKGAVLAVALVAALPLGYFFVSWEEARRIYFAVAAFHGYAELTMLAVILGSTLRTQAVPAPVTAD